MEPRLLVDEVDEDKGSGVITVQVAGSATDERIRFERRKGEGEDVEEETFDFDFAVAVTVTLAV